MTHQLVNRLLALAILAIVIVPVGGAVFVLGFLHGDSPCVMCWEQRIGMTLVALAGLFVLRYGPRLRYIGVAVFVAAWGAHMGMRHVGMHAARDIGQGFSVIVLGAHTYSWSLFIFWIALVTLAMLLVVSSSGRDLPDGTRPLGPVGASAAIAFLVVTGGNIVQAFCSTGPPPFMGQSDPVRFSFNPAHWVWSTEELTPGPFSWRGRWAIETPDVRGVDPAPANGPFASLPPLAIERHTRLAVPVRGAVTDLAYDSATRRFLLTTDAGLYILDDRLERIDRYTIVDTAYSVDLGRFAGAAFLEPHVVLAMGENKSYVVLKEDDHADASKNFRYFLESADKFDEVSRGRLETVRARMMYTQSAAFDPEHDAIYTVSVPNSRVQRLVVSRFARNDMTLSEEYTPTASSALRLTAGRSIDQLYVTGATIANGKMYAISAAGSTLLVIDLAARAITAAFEVPGLQRPTGLALIGDQLFIVEEDGQVTVVGKPLSAGP